MAKKKQNCDVVVRISRSALGRNSLNYRRTVQKWLAGDWALIDEFPNGDFLELTFRYKRFVLRPGPTIIGPGRPFPTAPHPSRFLNRSEAEKAAEQGAFLVDETEPPYEKMGMKWLFEDPTTSPSDAIQSVARRS